MNAPSSLPELADFIQTCYHQKQKLRIVGNGSKQHWEQADDRILVSPRELPLIFEHSADDLVVTVSANMPFGELQSRLERSKQFLAIAPPYADQASVGGIIATGITASIRHRYGGVRDMVLGIQFMRADGVIAKAGGKVVKNVAGYDLMKLLTGSWGTLVLITQVTLRLYPLSASRHTVQISGTSDQIKELTACLLRSGLTPTSVDLRSGQTELDQVHLLVEFAGLSASVSAQGDRLLQLVQNLENLQVKSLPAPPSLWQEDHGTVLIKLGILPSQAINLIQKFNQYSIQIHAGSGIGIAHIPHQIVPCFLKYCQENRGYGQILHPPDIRGIADNKSNSIQQAIKQKFDPYHIFPSYPF